MTTKHSKSISILGCGWLGFPLAKAMLSKEYKVKGSTTSHQKLNPFLANGIEPVIIQLNNLNEQILADFLNSDYLVIAIPPSSIDITKLEIVLQQASKSKIQKLILISSTGIYHETNTEIDEKNLDALDRSSKLFQVESLVNSFPNLNPVILRMAGLIGNDRQPVRYGKSPRVKANPNGRVNMIHQDDAVKVIVKVIESDIKNESFNCCADHHPTKEEFYTKLAKINQVEIPVFDSVTNDSFKIISNQKVKQMLDIEFMDLYEGLGKQA
jgi:nucleoside-diphosphate-sugar epimerase